MGERGPTATNRLLETPAHYFSRWENGGQPQRDCIVKTRHLILADGRTGANRNACMNRRSSVRILADGRTGANRNQEGGVEVQAAILADGRTGANRNGASRVPTLS